MKLLAAISQAIALITAVLYFAGWSYLYAFFREFSIGVNEVTLSLQDIVSYSFVVLRFAAIPFVPYLVPLAFVALLALVERSLLIQGEAYVLFADDAGRFAGAVRHFFGSAATKLTLLALLFVVIDFEANSAADQRVTELRENQPGTIHIDFKDNPPTKATCTDRIEPEGNPQSYSNARIICQVASFERDDNLKFLWQSASTLYVFTQGRETNHCLKSYAIVFRIPLDLVRSSEIVADFAYSKGLADAATAHGCD